MLDRQGCLLPQVKQMQQQYGLGSVHRSATESCQEAVPAKLHNGSNILGMNTDLTGDALHLLNRRF